MGYLLLALSVFWTKIWYWPNWCWKSWMQSNETQNIFLMWLSSTHTTKFCKYYIQFELILSIYWPVNGCKTFYLSTGEQFQNGCQEDVQILIQLSGQCYSLAELVSVIKQFGFFGSERVYEMCRCYSVSCQLRHFFGKRQNRYIEGMWMEFL